MLRLSTNGHQTIRMEGMELSWLLWNYHGYCGTVMVFTGSKVHHAIFIFFEKFKIVINKRRMYTAKNI